MSDLHGSFELREKVKELFLNIEHQVLELEDGIQVCAAVLPYAFHIQCDPALGWNVYLNAVTHSIEDDETTDRIYEQLECFLTELNEQYFSSDDNDDGHIAYHFFQLKAMTENMLESSQVRDTGRYVLKISLNDPPSLPVLEVGYSNIFHRWYTEVRNNLSPDQELDLRPYLEEVGMWVQNFNQTI